MNTIVCPHCKKELEISEAITQQIVTEKVSETEEKYKKEIEIAKKQATETALKKAQEEMHLTLKDKENEAEEAKQRNKKQQEELLEKTKLIRELKEKDNERELEMEKKLANKEEKIRKDAQQKAEEALHMQLLEKDKKLADVTKELDDARKKAQQGSQQTQGEAFELEFEEKLKNQFPNDKIDEVAKGTRGGDIIQEVWDRNGNQCGKILWELKNTKTWSEQWIDKLKNDQREISADFAVIISETVPPGVDTAQFHRNVWIVKRSFVIGLAYSLRLNLIQISMARRASEGNKQKKDIVYSYLSGTEFRLRIEAIVEAFSNMQTEIEKEKRYFNNKWARDEKNIRQVIDNTYGMHGDLKGIMGNVLPQIKGLELLESGDES